MRQIEDRAGLGRCVSGLRTVVCSTKDASDELVDRFWIALDERVSHGTADDAVAVGADW
jgi:hypothetical protein